MTGQRLNKCMRHGGKHLSAVHLTCLLLVLLVPLFSGCGSLKRLEHSFFAMDTYMTLSVTFSDETVLGEAERIVREIEERLSVTREESEISRLNRDGEAEISKETAELIERTLGFGKTTDGALDLTIYPVTKLWGFTTGDYRVPSEEEIREALSYVGTSTVQISRDTSGKVTASLPEGAMIDLGAVAKGYTGAVLRQFFLQKGVGSALLDLGGNIQAVGKKNGRDFWRIAVKDPQDSQAYLGVLKVDDMAVVTSGAYERYFEEGGKRYGHIMDPKTGKPAESGLLSVTVMGKDGTLCDAFSTALYVMGEEKAIALWKTMDSFECLMVTEDGRLLATEGMAELFEKDKNCSCEMEVIRR